MALRRFVRYVHGQTENYRRADTERDNGEIQEEMKDMTRSGECLFAMSTGNFNYLDVGTLDNLRVKNAEFPGLAHTSDSLKSIMLGLKSILD